MGMDAVELIMAVEEAFDFEIADYAAERMQTVGQMYAYILNRLSGIQPRRCPSSTLFYQTRRALIDLSGAPRRSIAPSTPLAALLPRQGRRSAWQTLSRVMEASLPALERPAWMHAVWNRMSQTLFLSCALAYFLCPITLAVRLSLAAALLVWAAARLTAPFAVHIPAPCATVGGAVRVALRSSGFGGPGSGREPDSRAVWRTLCGVIAEQFDVPPESITPETDFVYDLGAD